MKLRNLIQGLVVLASAFLVGPSPGQTYPGKPVRFILGYGTGNPTDLRARQIAAKFPGVFGQPLVVDNRPGGNGIIAAQAAAHAAPDGYTLYMGTTSDLSLNPWLFKNLPYNAEADFIPVTLVSRGPPMLAVNSQLQIRDIGELIALAKSKPGVLTNAGAPRGVSYLLMEQLKSLASIDIVQVPYKSLGAELPDLISGQVSMTFNYWSVLSSYVKSGRLRVIAVAGTKRLAAAPDVPTFAESGLPAIEAYAWQGVFVPAGTPKEIVGRLNAGMATILNAPEIRNQVIETGAEVGGNSSEEFAAFVHADRSKWGKVIADAKIVPE